MLVSPSEVFVLLVPECTSLLLHVPAYIYDAVYIVRNTKCSEHKYYVGARPVVELIGAQD